MSARALAVLLALVAALGLGAPAAGQAISCVENAGSTADIDIDLNNFDITTSGSHGVFALHGSAADGTRDGDVTIGIQGGRIEATGAVGVNGQHRGDGALTINVRDSAIASPSPDSSSAHSVFGRHRGNGALAINVRDSAISTAGPSTGVRGLHEGAGSLTVDVRGGSVMTGATGVDATHFGIGTDNNVNIVVRNVAITTMNDYDSFTFLNSPGILGARDGGGSGRVTIDVQGGTITTEGTEAYGIYGRNTGTGDIGISVRGGTITTESTGISRGVGALAHGVFGWQQAAGTGAVTITATGGSITTKGSYSYGIYGVHRGDGDITITTAGDNAITTAGDNAHGVVAYHYGTMDSRTIAVTVGGTIRAGGAGAHGVRIGVLNAEGEAARAAGMDADGYRGQTVTVNGAVMGGTGAGAGVWLAGGGRVVIGPNGSVGAASGIAILATGDTPVENGEPIKPRLHVSMNLDGRRAAEVLGDDWIVNDGGETTIVVNGVKLHDGAAGVTGLTAPNGARDVLIIQAEGVTVDRSTGAWVVSQRAAGVIADRDFSADDFTESSEPETPEEPTEEPTEEPKTPGRIIEVYAPRAAVYEALPGLLLGLTGGGRDGARLSGGRRRYGSDQRSAYDFKRIAADYESLPGVFRLGGSAGERLRLGGSPVWVRLSGGKGSYKSGEASVGAAYDFRRLARRKPGWTSRFPGTRTSPARSRCGMFRLRRRFPRRPGAGISTRRASARGWACPGAARAAIMSMAASR